MNEKDGAKDVEEDEKDRGGRGGGVVGGLRDRHHFGAHLWSPC